MKINLVRIERRNEENPRFYLYIDRKRCGELTTSREDFDYLSTRLRAVCSWHELPAPVKLCGCGEEFVGYENKCWICRQVEEKQKICGCGDHFDGPGDRCWICEGRDEEGKDLTNRQEKGD